MLAIIQRGAGQVAGECQIACRLKGKVIEVAPSSICRKKYFCVVWEIELQEVLVTVSQLTADLAYLERTIAESPAPHIAKTLVKRNHVTFIGV